MAAKAAVAAGAAGGASSGLTFTDDAGQHYSLGLLSGGMEGMSLGAKELTDGGFGDGAADLILQLFSMFQESQSQKKKELEANVFGF